MNSRRWLTSSWVAVLIAACLAEKRQRRHNSATRLQTSDTVGCPLLREVRGLGTLVPEDIRWIPATTQGRVERIRLRPGTAVRADSVILELSNPQVTQA